MAPEPEGLPVARLLEDLQQVMHGAAQQMYQASETSGSGPEASSGDKEGKGKSVDADFEVVED